MIRIDKLKKYRAELVTDEMKPTKPMGQNDLSCTACGLTTDYNDFTKRGQITSCPNCKSDEINDFYGLPYNRAESKRRNRR
jgi:predicted Zn-ribbon and HTH transcriptional regulator